MDECANRGGIRVAETSMEWDAELGPRERKTMDKLDRCAIRGALTGNAAFPILGSSFWGCWYWDSAACVAAPSNI
jgi:hypothetical protein